MTGALNIRGLNEETRRAFRSQAAARGMTAAEYLTFLIDSHATMEAPDGTRGA